MIWQNFKDMGAIGLFIRFLQCRGRNQKWYLDWLENQINAAPEAKYKVKIKADVQPDPVSYGKKLTVQSKITVWHLSDIEGSSREQIQSVESTISRLKDVKKLGKAITYKWGYSNLSFDLWMILHKHSCNAELANVDGYLRHINSAFSASFESMKKYKEEANFKRCLGELSLADVKTAIDRAKNIMLRNQRDGYPLTQYKGYAYYIHNPSLDLWQPIEAMLQECGLI